MQWDDLSRLVQLFKDNSLGELEYEDEHFRLKLSNTAPTLAGAPMFFPQAGGISVPARSDASAAAPTEGAASADVPKGKVVTSPFVGTFYRQPSPDSAPYVEVGQIVSRGQVLCIIEAMKLMNEIEAETSGRIQEIYAKNGQPVEFGEALFRIEPL